MPTSSLGHITTIGPKPVTLEVGGGAQDTKSSSSSSSTTSRLLLILLILLVTGAGIAVGIFAIDLSPPCITEGEIITAQNAWAKKYTEIGNVYRDFNDDIRCEKVREKAYELVSEFYIPDNSTLTVSFGSTERTTQDEIVSYLIGSCIDDDDVKHIDGDEGVALADTNSVKFTSMTYITSEKNAAFCYSPVATGEMKIDRKTETDTAVTTTLSYVADGQKVLIATQINGI